MRISAQETISDAALCSIGPGGPEWLVKEVEYRLALWLAHEIVKQYRDCIQRTGSLHLANTSYSLQLMVFNDEQLTEFVNHQIDRAIKNQEKRK